MDKFGLTPLHLAAWYGQTAVAELLLMHGANVNAADRFQKTAVQKAELNNHRSIVELLLRNNAIPIYNQPLSLMSLSRKAFLHVDARSGFNRLQAAVFHGDYRTVLKAHALLDNYVQDMNLKKTGSRAKVFPGRTASEIISALRKKGEGNVDIEKLYVESVEKVDTLIELHLSKCNNDAEKAVEIVLNEGVDINIPGKSNRTPLLWASPSASGEFIQTLIDLGADVNAQRTDDKVTPWYLAASWNNYMAVDILLKHGASVNLPNIYEETTPLHLAAINGNIPVVKKLVEFNADIDLKVDGKDAADLAQMNEETEIEEYLKSRRSLSQRDSESHSAESQLVESHSAENQSEESQWVEGKLILRGAIKGAKQGLKFLEQGLKFFEEKYG
ncbi:ankyrin-1-like [Stylophora pistillata]|uniref:ankyrin-1-like n=1 Tax=Stylophora pistillata TaxID=50429 RepID=UPI000C045B75|nr:ankyrin-1-like [Stylophora pistillata]